MGNYPAIERLVVLPSLDLDAVTYQTVPTANFSTRYDDDRYGFHLFLLMLRAFRRPLTGLSPKTSL